jgi:Amt family ammonium transporter
VKQTLKIDDSLDVFAVHGVGGLTGILLAAFPASPSFGGGGLPEGQTMIGQFGVQLLGAAATFAWSLVASFVILKAIQMTIGLRVSNDDEIQGIDISAHGENAYNLSREI